MDFSVVAGMVVSFLVVAFGLCVTLHLAAAYLLGGVSTVNAIAGVVPAIALVLLAPFNLPLAVGSAIVTDFIAIRVSYQLSFKPAVTLTIGHVAISVILAFALSNLVRLIFAPP